MLPAGEAGKVGGDSLSDLDAGVGKQPRPLKPVGSYSCRFPAQEI
jgi:hypothetical protein